MVSEGGRLDAQSLIDQVRPKTDWHLTATAAIYITFVFLVSLTGKILADRLRQRYGLAAS